MTRATRYVQCTLVRTTSRGVAVTTSYIPQRFAKVGKTLKLKDELDRWCDGWTVESAGENVIDAESVVDYRKAIRLHRQQTGDNLPKLDSV
jgi:hypothetical protein